MKNKNTYEESDMLFDLSPNDPMEKLGGDIIKRSLRERVNSGSILDTRSITTVSEDNQMGE